MIRPGDGPAVLAFQRFGPYHHARLRAVAERMPVVGLELGTVDEYAWRYEAPAHDVPFVTAFGGENPDEVSPRRLTRRLDEILDAWRPSMVAVPGWGQRCALAVLVAAQRTGAPTILMSDSTQEDARRTVVVEKIKSRIVQNFSSALVAGSRHRAYLTSLGFPTAGVTLGFDVVENAHFASPSGCRRDASDVPSSVGNASFLVVSRFVARKNLGTLIAAYDRYAAEAGPRAWGLRIVGDGPERDRLLGVRDASPHRDRIVIDRFRQYEELPAVYAAAACLVLPSLSDQWGLVVNEAMAAGLPVLVSERCGCAPDLVEEGVNGFVFDPEDAKGLARLMGRIAGGDVDLDAFGDASRRIIAGWDLSRFVDGFESAARTARAVGAKTPSRVDALLLEALLRR